MNIEIYNFGTFHCVFGNIDGNTLLMTKCYNQKFETGNFVNCYAEVKSELSI